MGIFKQDIKNYYLNYKIIPKLKKDEIILIKISNAEVNELDKIKSQLVERYPQFMNKIILYNDGISIDLFRKKWLK